MLVGLNSMGGKAMAKTPRNGKQAWSTPELHRIVAGSAEAASNKGLQDTGTPPSQDKS